MTKNQLLVHTAAETYLLGQQSGLATKELERVRPSLAIRFLTLAMGSMPSRTTSWSSVRMNRKFGRVFCREGYTKGILFLDFPGFPLLSLNSKHFPSFMETTSFQECYQRFHIFQGIWILYRKVCT